MTGRLGLLAASACLWLAGCHEGSLPTDSKGSAEQEEAHVAVRTEPARRGTLVRTVEGLGRSEAVPDKLATLTPAVEGHVHDLLVKQGEEVAKGQIIVELDTSVALADLAEKAATLEGLKAALALLKAPPRPEERRANELAIEQAQVALDRATRIAERLKPLVAHREASDQQVFEAELAVRQARLVLQTAEAQLQVLLIGPKPEAIAEAEAKVKTAEGAVEFSQAHLEYHTIRSPIDGVLDSLICHPGQTIAIGTPIGEVVDTHQIVALVYLPASSALAVRVGQPAKVRTVDSRLEPGDSSEETPPVLEGKVEFVGRIADPQTGNLPVQVLVDNPEGLLTVGQTVSLSIAVEQKEGVLEVPSAAILDLGEGPVLTVVREGKTAELHPEVGASQGGWVAVSGTDLAEGEPVVVEGGYNLPEGTPVEVGGETTEPEKVTPTEPEP
jgi:multidrug efflux pump subunit AcrA (membrane-fusion protein)